MIPTPTLLRFARHAHASVVQVDLQADDHNARLTVSDNGCGFPFRGHYDDAALTSTGFGPAIIKSRVASLGGADSAAGERALPHPARHARLSPAAAAV